MKEKDQLDGRKFFSELSFLKKYMQSWGFWYSLLPLKINLPFVFYPIFVQKQSERMKWI